MGTKMKGLIKGIKNISSQIFDDEKEKEQEIQIGQPTDVKHLSHIGSCDGPAMESPSWIKGFDQSKESQSGAMIETPEVKAGASEGSNSNHRKARRNGSNHSRSVETASDHAPLLPRSSRNRRRSMDINNTQLHSESQGKMRHTRRYKSEGRTRSNSQNQKSGGEDSKADAPKKSTTRRRQKTKEESSITRSPTKSTADHESDIV